MHYGGDLSAVECWELLQNDPSAMLIDVRTKAEWTFVGVPELANRPNQLVLLEWQTFPTMASNDAFVDELVAQLVQSNADKETKLCFICRSGARSLSAAQAMTAAGYTNSFNVECGFEGDRDSNGQRGRINGWKADNLPWHQG